MSTATQLAGIPCTLPAQRTLQRVPENAHDWSFTAWPHVKHFMSRLQGNPAKTTLQSPENKAEIKAPEGLRNSRYSARRKEHAESEIYRAPLGQREVAGLQRKHHKAARSVQGLRKGLTPTSDAEDIIISQGLLLCNKTGET